MPNVLEMWEQEGCRDAIETRLRKDVPPPSGIAAALEVDPAWVSGIQASLARTG